MKSKKSCRLWQSKRQQRILIFLISVWLCGFLFLALVSWFSSPKPSLTRYTFNLIPSPNEPLEFHKPIKIDKPLAIPKPLSPNPHLATLAKVAFSLSSTLAADPASLLQKTKVYKSLFENLYINNASIDAALPLQVKSARDGLTALEDMFYIKKSKFPSLLHLYTSYQGRGIVMSTGNWHFRYARHAIHVIRALNCTLPIEMYYTNTGDLHEAYIQELKSLPNVTLINAQDFIHPDKAASIGGWSVKPFAMLVSKFKEIIFIDADGLFFQNPATLFDWDSYTHTGTVYFRDRTIGAGDTSALDFFKSMVPRPSDFAKQQRMWRKLSQHEGESGVIVMDKSRGGFFVLLMASLMNMDPIKDQMYKNIHGDKESYWMASEALQVPYAWGPGAGGTVGFLNPDRNASVCGGLYHVDENWDPLWFNGGVIMNKHSEKGRQVFNLTHWAVDKTYRHMIWDWEESTRPFCLSPQNPQENTGELSKEYQARGRLIVDLWNILEGNLKPSS